MSLWSIGTLPMPQRKRGRQSESFECLLVRLPFQAPIDCGCFFPTVLGTDDPLIFDNENSWRTHNESSTAVDH